MGTDREGCSYYVLWQFLSWPKSAIRTDKEQPVLELLLLECVPGAVTGAAVERNCGTTQRSVFW
jgi:hypothetical protein